MPSKAIEKILLLCLVAAVVSVKVDHLSSEADSYVFFKILNTMMQRYQLPKSIQIPNCFSDTQKDILTSAVNKITATASEVDAYSLRSLPQMIISYLNKNIGQNPMKCLYFSRDFSLLFRNYATDFGGIGSAFASYTDKKYLTAHKYFLQLQNALSSGDYQAYGLKLDQFLQNMLGNRTLKQDEWQKSVINLQNYNPAEYYGVSVSNGVIGAVSSIKPITVATTVLAGAYDVFGRGRVDNIVQTFPALQVQIDYGRDITQSGFYNYEQSLKFGSGQFEGAFSSDYCSVRYSYFALKNLPFAFYTQVELFAHKDYLVSIRLKHQAPDYLNNIQKYYESIDSKDRFDIIHTKATTKTGNLDLIIASSYILPEALQYDLMHEDWDSNLHFLKLKTKLQQSNTYKFGFITCLMSTAHHQDPQNQAIRIIERAVSIGSDNLIKKHREYWSDLWKNDIIIEGQENDQKDIRLMLYHCYAFINDWKSYGISPMGLSGLGYNGHVFWDMDLWIYPGILALKPELAKTLIQYRFQRLEAAKNNAFINGYKGAMYPWESSSLGVEETPVWALTGPLEHHISGCVAFAAWNYYCVTQDLDWLRTKGYPIISSVADFWVSRVQLGSDQLYHINNVVAADQWAQNVDDNAFTNAVAIKSLKIANTAAKKLGMAQNPTYSSISQKIVILKFDNNITQQHRTYQGESIKQADVNLLSFPLKIISNVDQTKRDLAYYQTRIPNAGTPAMTYSVFTILYSRLKDPVNAYKYFTQSFKDNLRKPFNVFAETKGGTNPYFLTGAGGVIQSMVFGFGGYDITDSGLIKIETALPKEWKKVEIKGFMKGSSQKMTENIIST